MKYNNNLKIYNTKVNWSTCEVTLLLSPAVYTLWSGLWRFKLHGKWPKGWTISSCCFLGNDTKEWFLTNWGRDNNTQGVHKHSKFWKNFTVSWVRLWTTSKYSFMDNDLKSIFVGHIHFKKLMKFQKFIEIFHCCLSRLRNKK